MDTEEKTPSAALNDALDLLISLRKKYGDEKGLRVLELLQSVFTIVSDADEDIGKAALETIFELYEKESQK